MERTRAAPSCCRWSEKRRSSSSSAGRSTPRSWSPPPSLQPSRSWRRRRAYGSSASAAPTRTSAGIRTFPSWCSPAASSTWPPTCRSATRRYYQAGVPFLQRYLPFWAANLVDRLWVMLVPIIAVVVPLGRIVPALYRWRVRSRVFRWYARLKQIELQLEENPGRQSLDDMKKRLEETDRAVNQIPTPLASAENLYFFREHVDVVRRRIVRRLSNEPDAGVADSEKLLG